MTLQRNLLLVLLLTALSWAGLSAPAAYAKNQSIEITQRGSETQIRHLIEPLLDKFCRDQCKLLAVQVNVDVEVPEEIAPGFDDIQAPSGTGLAPTSARLKLLVDDKVGPVSRGKLLELLQQYLDTMEYPVHIDTQIAHFPQPIGSEGRIAELRERVAKQFQSRMNDLITQFCPEQCMLADFNLKTEVVNGEESQYGSPNEFVQDGGVAIRIKDISATILMDEALSPEERGNLLEMAKLRTNSFKNVTLEGKSLKFPHPAFAGAGGGGLRGQFGLNGDRRLSSETTDSKESKTDSKVDTTNATNATTNTNQTKQENSTNSNTSTNSKNENRNDSQNTTSTTNKSNNLAENKESTTKQERFERTEKIERVENGDAIHEELQKFKFFGLIFGCSILSLLIFIAMAAFRPARKEGPSSIQRVIQSLAADPMGTAATPSPSQSHSEESGGGRESRSGNISKRYEIERLHEELMSIFAQHPKVAKHVFSRVLTEEGVEVTAQYIDIFGEGVVVDMLRDPSLQGDMTELMDFYAKNPMQIEDDEKLDLLRKLHNRTVAGKLIVLGNRSSNLFDFLAEMDFMQILELIRNESLSVKAIILTQCDPQKRASLYSHLDEDTRMKMLSELSRIDHLPRDYIFNVSNALKRKRRENPRLNTESLPGSEVLVSLLERTGTQIQRAVVKNLENTNPESARTVKGKLVSIETLRFLRDSQLLEVVLSLKHEELLQFLKGTSDSIRKTIYSKSPKELVLELEEELAAVTNLSREVYQNVERKVLNRMKVMANDGLINLTETNERMFANGQADGGFVQGGPAGARNGEKTSPAIKKAAGW